MHDADRRVKFTKMVLRESLLELMREKPIGEITVTELCKNARVLQDDTEKSQHGHPHRPRFHSALTAGAGGCRLIGMLRVAGMLRIVGNSADGFCRLFRCYGFFSDIILFGVFKFVF